MRKLRLILTVLAALSAASCTADIQDIRIDSVNVASASVRGLGTIVLDVDIGVHNPSVAFTIETLHGTLRYKGGDLLHADASDIRIERRSDKVYRVPLLCRAASGTGLLPLLRDFGAGSFDSGLTLDVTADIRARFGLGKVFEYNGIPVGNFLDRQ